MKKIRFLLTALLLLTLSITTLSVVSTAEKHDAPSNASIISGSLIDIDTSKSYEVAKIILPQNENETEARLGEYTDYVAGQTSLSAGLWSVRTKADGETEASDAVVLWSRGDLVDSLSYEINNSVADKTPDVDIEKGSGKWYFVNNSTEDLGDEHSEAIEALYTNDSNYRFQFAVNLSEKEEFLTGMLSYQFSEEEYVPAKNFSLFGGGSAFNISLASDHASLATSPTALKGATIIHTYDPETNTTKQYKVAHTNSWSPVKGSAGWVGINVKNTMANATGYVYRVDFDFVNEDVISLEDITIDTSAYSVVFIRPYNSAAVELRTRIPYAITSTKEFVSKLAPETTLSYTETATGFTITGLNSSLTYRYSSDGVTFSDVPAGVTSVNVESAGTYYFYSVASETYYVSDMASIEIVEAVRPDAPEGLSIVGGKLIDIDEAKSYEVAKITLPQSVKEESISIGEYTDYVVGETNLTAGLWAVRTKADGNTLASVPVSLWSRGENVDSISYDVNTVTGSTKNFDFSSAGQWSFVNKNNYDTSYTITTAYNNNYGYTVTAGPGSKKVFSTGTFSYLFAEDEYIPAKGYTLFGGGSSVLLELGANAQPLATTPASTLAKAVIYVYNDKTGEIDKYESATPRAWNPTTTGSKGYLNLKTQIPSDAEGYIYRIDYDFVDESEAINPNTVNNTVFTIRPYNGLPAAQRTRIPHATKTVDGVVTLVSKVAPEITLSYMESGSGYMITGLDATRTYRYSADGITFSDVPAGSDCLNVTDTGTYYFYSVEDAAYYASDMVSIEIKAIVRPDAPTGLGVERSKVTGLEEGIAYEYAQLIPTTVPTSFQFVPATFNTLTSDTVLTGGLWAVRCAACDTTPASEYAVLYSLGKDVGSITPAAMGTTVANNLVAGSWKLITTDETPATISATWDASNWGIQLALYDKTEDSQVIETYLKGYWSYLFTNEEIVPVSAFKNFKTGHLRHESASGVNVVTSPTVIDGDLIVYVYDNGSVRTYSLDYNWNAQVDNTPNFYAKLDEIVEEHPTGYIYRMDIDIVKEDGTTPYSSLTVNPERAQADGFVSIERWKFTSARNSDNTRVTYNVTQPAPTPTLSYTENEDNFTITGFDLTKTYMFSSDGITYTEISGVESYDVDSTGTYYVYQKADWDNFASPITEIKVLSLLEITITPPTKTTYTLGETLDTTGMSVMALYSDGSSVDVTELAQVSHAELNTTGQISVNVNYLKFSDSFTVTVNPSVEIPGSIVSGIFENISWTLMENGTLTVSGEGAIPNFVRNTNNAPWYEYSRDITSITVEDGITSIGNYAFYNLSKATTISVAESVKRVGIQFIRGCAALREIELPGVEVIAGNAFGVSSITRLVLSEKVHDIQGNMFYAEAITVVAPEGSYVDYYLRMYTEIFGTKATPTFEANGTATRKILDFQKAGQSVFYTLYKETNNTLTVEYSGAGKMTNFAYYSAKNIARGYTFSPTRMIFQNGVVGTSYTFKNIQNVVLGDDIINLGNYALEMLGKIKDVELGDKMIRLGNSVFKSMSLKNFVIPEGVVLIGNNAFTTCPLLESVTFPTSIPAGDPNTMDPAIQVGMGADIFFKTPNAEGNNPTLKVITENKAVIDYMIKYYPNVAKNSGFGQVVVNVPADAFEKVIVNTESDESVFEENIRAYLAKYFTANAVDVIDFNVAYKRSIVPSDVFDSMLYNIALDENGFVIRDENGNTTKTKIEAPDTMLGKYNRVLERGIDVVGMAVDITKELGADVWFSIRMNDTHYYELENFNSSLSNYYSDKFGIDGKKNSLDFKHEQVREYYKAYILELCENYDIDGIELDFLRSAPYFADPTTGKSLMTDFVGELSAEIDKIADATGKEIQLNVRVYSEASENLTYGLDVVNWVANGDIDVVTASGHYIPTYYNIPIDTWRTQIDAKNTAGHPYTLLCATDWAVRCDSRAEEGFMMWLTLEQLKGFVSASYQKGADGIYFFNHFTDSTFNTYYVDENGVRTQEYVLDDKLLSAKSKKVAETGTRSYVNTCKAYSNSLYPKAISTSYSFDINTGTKITNGDYVVIIGVDEIDGYDENLLTVSVNGAQARQISDVVAKTGFKWAAKKGVTEPVAEHVSEVAPRVMQFTLEDLSVLNDGNNTITITNTDSGKPQKIKWLEVQVTAAE